MLIVRHLGTPNSGFNGCHCMRDPVLYRSMVYMQCQILTRNFRNNLLLECVCTVSVSFTKLRIVDNEVATQKICHKLSKRIVIVLYFIPLAVVPIKINTLSSSYTHLNKHGHVISKKPKQKRKYFQSQNYTPRNHRLYRLTHSINV